MEEKKNTRIQLDDEMLEDVNGGTLKLIVSQSGSSIKWYDTDFNVIGTYTVSEANIRNVYTFLKGPYWNLDAGKRDEQALAYMRDQGWL